MSTNATHFRLPLGDEKESNLDVALGIAKLLAMVAATTVVAIAAAAIYVVLCMVAAAVGIIAAIVRSFADGFR